MVIKEQIDDIRFLGGIFVLIESGIKGASFAETFRGFFQVLQESHGRGLQSGTDPGGSPWDPLKPATVARKGHAQILVETGRLGMSLAGMSGDSIRETTNIGAIFGTRVPYSGYHQRGGGKLPQRMHVGMGEAELDELANRVADHAVESMKGTI